MQDGIEAFHAAIDKNLRNCKAIKGSFTISRRLLGPTVTFVVSVDRCNSLVELGRLMETDSELQRIISAMAEFGSVHFRLRFEYRPVNMS